MFFYICRLNKRLVKKVKGRYVMGFLIFTARVHDLIHQKHEVEYKLAKLTKKMRDMQRYSSLVANGGVSIGDLLNSPGTMMGRAMNYLSYAHNTSLQYMNQNAPAMQMMYQQQIGAAQNPQQQMMMQNYIMRSLYTQGRDYAAQVETRNLKDEEAKMQSEKEQLETQAQEIAQELKAAKEARDQDIKDMAPKYTASA